MNSRMNYIMWNMTRKCNYRCGYCYFPHDNSPVDFTLPVEKILAFLDARGEQWRVGMTGGEPFIYPKFLEICEALTQRHVLDLDTNLSVSGKIRQFAERIDPGKVHSIYAGLHIEERERNKGVEAFIKNYHTLKSRYFNIIVNYVLHPRLLPRYEDDAAFYAERGVPLKPRPFKGVFEEKKYPQAYDERARGYFAGHAGAGKKVVFNFKGVPCEGGRSFVRLEPDGTIFKCAGDRSVLGNILNDFTLSDEAAPCQTLKCPCRGPDYVHLDPVQQDFMDGVEHFLTGEKAPAKIAFEKVLEQTPDGANALNNLGVLAFQEKEYANAVGFFAKAHAGRPGSKLYAENLDLAEQAVRGEVGETVPSLSVCFVPEHEI